MTKKRKVSWRRIFGIVLIVIGLALVAINFLPNPNIERNIAKSQEATQELTAEEMKRNNEADDATFDFSAVESINPTSTYVNPVDIDSERIVGQLIVPQTEIDMTIFKGINNEILLAGVGTMRNDQVMGQGNYTLAGHYDWNDSLLHRLDWIKAGDVIRITDKEKIYEYIAVENAVVEPTATHLITDDYAEERYGKPTISIMNCFYPQRFVNADDDRYFVFGILVNETDYAEEKMHRADFNWDNAEEKAAFEKDNPVNSDAYALTELKENQWQARETTLENKQ